MLRNLIVLAVLVAVGCSDSRKLDKTTTSNTTVEQASTKPLVATGDRAVSRDSLKYWITKLEDQDPKVLVQTTDALARMGKSAVPALVEVLEGAVKRGRVDTTTYIAAAEALSRISTEADVTVPVLLKTSWGTNNHTAKILDATHGILATLGPAALPALVATMENKEVNLMARREATDVGGWDQKLGAHVKPPVPWLIELLEPEYPSDDWLRAMRLLGEIGPDAKDAAPALRQAMTGCNLRLMSAVNDVSGIPTEGTNLVIVAAVDHVLHFRIFDGDGTVVVDTHEKRLTEQARQIEVLRTELESLWPPNAPTNSKRAHVIKAATSITGHTQLAYMHTSPMDPHDPRIDAAIALGRIAPEDKELIRTMGSYLHSNDSYRINASLKYFADNSKNAREYIPAIIELTQNKDGYVAIQASLTIWRVDHQTDLAVRTLQKLLYSDHPGYPVFATMALGEIGLGAKESLQKIEQQLVGGTSLATQSALALHRIGGQTQKAISVLTTRLTDTNPNTRRDAVDSLGEMGTAAKSAIPLLVQRLQDEYSDPDFSLSIRLAAIRALKKIDVEEAAKAGVR